MHCISRLASSIPGFLFVASIPLFLIAGCVIFAVNDAGLYNRGFQRYNVSAMTGITYSDLAQAGADIRHYFNSAREPLSVRTRIYGLEQELFNQREVIHMADVKRLFWGVYVVGGITAAYLIILTLGGLVWRRQQYNASLAGYYLKGGILTLALVLAVGLFSVTGFDTLFLKFHQISFRNDLWLLNPNTDYLLLMFPQRFWLYSTLWVAAMTIISAMVIVTISGSYLLWRRQSSEQGIGHQASTMTDML